MYVYESRHINLTSDWFFPGHRDFFYCLLIPWLKTTMLHQWIKPCPVVYNNMLVLLSSIYLLCGSLLSLLCARECKCKCEMRYTVWPIVSNYSTDWQLTVGCWDAQQCINKGILTSSKVNVNKSCFKISKKTFVQVLCGRKRIPHMLVLKVTNIAFWFVAVNVNINLVCSQKSSIGNLI